MRSMHNRKRQGGAVAILVGISMFMLMALLGLVLDLGQIYIGKTELQNAADAAALAGAKKLKGTSTSVQEAVNRAIATFGSQNFTSPLWTDLGNIDTITVDNIWVGHCPGDPHDDPDPDNDDGCMVPASEVIDGSEPAGDKYFLKVHTRHRDIATLIMRVWGSPITRTYANAVAGPYVADVAPIGVCAIEVATVGGERVCDGPAASPPPTNVVECGYQRGVAYNIHKLNDELDGLGPGNFLWLDPLATSPATCDPNHSSTNFFYPFVCTGRLGFVPTVGGQVYVNTGQFSTSHEKNLNSRFDNPSSFTGGNSCSVGTAPPDSNVKKYTPAVAAQWMAPNPQPTQQSLLDPHLYRSPIAYGDAGVLWSFSRPQGATTADWDTLYSGAQDPTSYPNPSPYESGGIFSSPPPNHPPGVSGRRVLNVVIVDCPSAGGSCRPMDVLGIGQFFMQTEANSQSSNKTIDVEFAGIISTAPNIPLVRLYR